MNERNSSRSTSVEVDGMDREMSPPVTKHASQADKTDQEERCQTCDVVEEITSRPLFP